MSRASQSAWGGKAALGDAPASPSRPSGRRLRWCSTPLASRSRLAASRTLLSAASTISSPEGSFAPSSADGLVGDVQRLVDHGTGGRLHLGSLLLGEGARRLHRSVALLAEHLILDPRARERASDGSAQGHRDCPGDERLVLDQSVEAMAHVAARPGSAPTRGSGAMADSAAGIADRIAGPIESGARRMRQFGGALADALDRFGDPLANPAGNVGYALAKAALARCFVAIRVL